eukprot:559659-Hanusia_phi.AAC.1
MSAISQMNFPGYSSSSAPWIALADALCPPPVSDSRNSTRFLLSRRGGTTSAFASASMGGKWEEGEEPEILIPFHTPKPVREERKNLGSCAVLLKKPRGRVKPLGLNPKSLMCGWQATRPRRREEEEEGEEERTEEISHKLNFLQLPSCELHRTNSAAPSTKASSCALNDRMPSLSASSSPAAPFPLRPPSSTCLACSNARRLAGAGGGTGENSWTVLAMERELHQRAKRKRQRRDGDRGSMLQSLTAWQLSDDAQTQTRRTKNVLDYPAGL